MAKFNPEVLGKVGVAGLSAIALMGAGLPDFRSERAQAREPAIATTDPAACTAQGTYIQKFEKKGHDYARLLVLANCGKGNAPWFHWLIKVQPPRGQEAYDVKRSRGSVTQIGIPSMDTALSGTIDVGYKSESHTLPIPFHISGSEMSADQVFPSS